MATDPKDVSKTSVRDHLEDAVEQVTDSARGAAEDVAHTASAQAAAEVETGAEAARAASDAFDPGTVQARVTEEVAAQLQSVARNLRATDLEDAVTGVSRFARQNPLLFLGGAALVGVAVGRFLKASGSASQAASVDPTGEDPWSGYATETPIAPGRGAADEGYRNGRAGA